MFTVSLGKNRARVHLPGEDGHGDDYYLVLGGKMDSQTLVCGINCCNLDYIYLALKDPGRWL